MEKQNLTDLRFMPREQLLKLAENFEPISVREEGSGSILRKFCVGAYSRMRGLKRTSVHTLESDMAAERVREYVRDTPEFSNVLRFVGMGSSRITFALQDGSALKFAYNSAGVAQNKKEAAMMQTEGGNVLPCFPKVYEHTEDWRGMLVECCSPVQYEDFRVFAPLGEFSNLMSAIIYLVENKKKFFNGNNVRLKSGMSVTDVGEYLSIWIEDTKEYGDVYGRFVNKLLSSNDYQWGSLRALFELLLKFADRSTLADLENIQNWGLIINKENGNVNPVVVDMGFDRKIFRRFY